LQNSFARIQNPNLKGWIIDLRGNKGGDLTPMITSVKPFFGDTTIFTLKDRNNKLTTYKFSSGFYTIEKGGNSTKILAYKSGIEKVRNIPVAILIDNKSASSAEMVAIAFKGKANTIFFGEPTAGLTICTNGFTLSDNAFFTIATGRFYDTKSISYEHSITPDIFVKQEVNKPDETRQKAIEWLLKQ
jgi:carboxyl-terminal processing protease